jgi:tetratricopeptide (TPR) repeat protein
MTSAREVSRRLYPSYHKPLEIASAWLREGGARRADALELLRVLRQRYPHALAAGNELVLALIENGCDGEALDELRRMARRFPLVNEETRGRWGRLYKNMGDCARKAGDLVRAEERYRQALEQYRRGYDLRQGHYPGINAATMLLLLAALAGQRQENARSAEYLRQSEAAADGVLARRADWPRDLSDDNVWHPATAGEAALLKRRWPEAASQYRAALGEANVQPFHREKVRAQAQRILDAWALLGVEPERPFESLDVLLGQAPPPAAHSPPPKPQEEESCHGLCPSSHGHVGREGPGRTAGAD